MALTELSEAPADRQKAFNCASCTDDVRRQRRCGEAREDFTWEKDKKLWPIKITPNGDQYGFCPGKATWDPAIIRLYESLVISAETGVMWEDGPLSQQPSWWVDLLGWFIPNYRKRMFESRVNALMGGDAGKLAAAVVGRSRGS